MMVQSWKDVPKLRFYRAAARFNGKDGVIEAMAAS